MTIQEQISELDKIIQEMKAHGLDPTHYYDAKNDKMINLIALRESLDNALLAEEATAGLRDLLPFPSFL